MRAGGCQAAPREPSAIDFGLGSLGLANRFRLCRNNPHANLNRGTALCSAIPEAISPYGAALSAASLRMRSLSMHCSPVFWVRNGRRKQPPAWLASIA